MDLPRAVKTASAVTAWSGLAFIAFATMSPIADRPHIASQGLEHVGAFALVGLLFGVAHPRRLPLVAAGLFAAAGALEIAQHLTPDRHGRLLDFGRKLVGGGIGLALAASVNLCLQRSAWNRRDC